jgi:hypothetical protein
LPAKRASKSPRELGRRFGIRSPQQLSIGQAREMIDHLKQSLTPTPA